MSIVFLVEIYQKDDRKRVARRIFSERKTAHLYAINRPLELTKEAEGDEEYTDEDDTLNKYLDIFKTKFKDMKISDCTGYGYNAYWSEVKTLEVDGEESVDEDEEEED